MKKLILLFTIVLAGFNGKAQTSSGSLDPSLENEPLFIPESWDIGLDSLLNSWHVKYYTHKMQNQGYKESVPASDAVYRERLAKLNTIVELPYNAIVRNSIDVYVERRRSMVEYMLGLETFYFPMIEEALDKNQLPDELKYLTIVESALNPTAFSRAGASGLWQFMHQTGKQYGLEINSLVDERRDPLKATYAACQYIKDMYKIFGDWTLVIASYNCGSGNVNKAIRRAGGSRDYWKIYPYLPRETRMYVPYFIAVNYVMNYYAQHQLFPVQTELPPSTDTIMVNQSLHFDQIAAVLGIEKEHLRALNPQYKRDIIPGDKPRSLRLPTLQAYAFIELQDTIAKHKANEIFGNRSSSGDMGVNNTERITHRVKRGESVGTIASRYGVSASSIRQWNKLRSNKVAVGRNLIIYMENGGYAMASTYSSAPAPAATASNKTTNTPPAGKSTQNTTPNTKKTDATTVPYQKYKVKAGESFYSIAKKYPGYTHLDIMRMNKMTANSLKAGQYIIVPKV